jgi:hypothetical protein
MGYYVRDVPNLLPEVWSINDAVAFRLGVTNPPRFEARPGETAWDTLKRDASAWFEPPGTQPFHKTALGPGQFYPRIARPAWDRPSDFPRVGVKKHGDTDFVVIARSQLIALTRQLELICQTVHPNETTLDTFGHNIRNLLILACTEVETHWRGVLVANNLIKDQYRTADYVKLQAAMRLGDYALTFPSFPWLMPVRPFKDWGTTGRPTQELAWYAAYNAVKHNREYEFERATLRNVFDALSACAIMMIAQFGSTFGLGRNSELATFFNVYSFPHWSLSDVYLSDFGESKSADLEVNYPFSL